jgi:L-lactate dehydrogenase complex protein LldG
MTLVENGFRSVDSIAELARRSLSNEEVDSMYEQFKSRAEGVGAEVHRFRGRNEAVDFVMAFLLQEGVPNPSAVWADGPFLSGMDREELSQKAPGLDFTVSRQTAADSLIGISEMDWALADTGSLVADQTAVEQRLASTLPQVHIAIIGTDRILPDKAALFGKIDPRSSRYIAFITGPSRTADIERVLTIGVHGPKRLVIVFVDEAGGVAQ